MDRITACATLFHFMSQKQIDYRAKRFPQSRFTHDCQTAANLTEHRCETAMHSERDQNYKSRFGAAFFIVSVLGQDSLPLQLLHASLPDKSPVRSCR